MLDAQNEIVGDIWLQSEHVCVTCCATYTMRETWQDLMTLILFVQHIAQIEASAGPVHGRS